jgi:hypothetical protein
MTYSDNRNRKPGGDNTAMWIIGAIAAVIVIGAIAWGLSDSGTQTASDRPAATTGQTTPAPSGGTGAQSGGAQSGGASAPAGANR